jgi:hypothetical protein
LGELETKHDRQRRTAGSIDGRARNNYHGKAEVAQDANTKRLGASSEIFRGMIDINAYNAYNGDIPGARRM